MTTLKVAIRDIIGKGEKLDYMYGNMVSVLSLDVVNIPILSANTFVWTDPSSKLKKSPFVYPRYVSVWVSEFEITGEIFKSRWGKHSKTVCTHQRSTRGDFHRNLI